MRELLCFDFCLKATLAAAANRRSSEFGATILFALLAVNALDWFIGLWLVLAFDMVPAMEEIQTPLQSCPHCAVQMPPTAAFCPGCGRSMHAEPKAQGKVGPLPESIAGGLAYLTFLPAIIFLLVDPFKRNRFVRFHSFQCLFACGVAILLAALIRIASLIVFMIPVVGPLLISILVVVLILAAVFLWLVVMVKALQGEWFRLPVLGEFADRYADPISGAGDKG